VLVVRVVSTGIIGWSYEYVDSYMKQSDCRSKLLVKRSVNAQESISL